MKTKWYSMIGLALAVCLGLAVQSPAKKPIKPPPDPDPELPFTYQRVEVVSVDGAITYLNTINDYGMVVGKCYFFENELLSYAFRAYPQEGGYTVSEENAFVNIWNPMDNDPYAANNLGQIIGAYNDNSYTVLRLALWNESGSGIDLGLLPFSDVGAGNYSINDAGLIVGVNNGNPAFLIIPEDTDGDGAADTWYADADGDGINDLVYFLENGTTPVAINEAGQILFEEGVVLTPSGDGYSITVLSESEDDVRTKDINDAGQIVGSVGGRAVMWEISGGQETITELGTPTRKAKNLVATSINNAGQIVGVNAGARERERFGFFYQDGDIYKLSDLMNDGSELHPSRLQINDEGWILDTGTICIPVPEP